MGALFVTTLNRFSGPHQPGDGRRILGSAHADLAAQGAENLSSGGWGRRALTSHPGQFGYLAEFRQLGGDRPQGGQVLVMCHERVTVVSAEVVLGVAQLPNPSVLGRQVSRVGAVGQPSRRSFGAL